VNQKPEPARFSRELRLTEAAQYKKVFAGSSRFGNRYLTILACENDLPHPRLGMAISKKCAKRAVDRNRIKRLIRENFRHTASSLPPVDMVVMCRPVILELSNDMLVKQLEKQWYFIRKKMVTIQQNP
jgi:ribonuclease P protein component